ncbi:hypothetical protein EJ110_NYTH21134 [Nymphaea thermarum]|nr:hypothetical protein EJ110_NYTH21134 [Nymphaea thermarum]
MAKKRKSDVTGLDELDRTMYATFCSAANSLSQLYTQAQSQQKLMFQAGERFGMEKLYEWILKQHEEGSRVTAADVIAYLQKELDYDLEETSSPESQMYQHSSQPQMMHSDSDSLICAGGQTFPRGARPTHTDQHKNSIVLNGLSTPVRSSLQPFQLPQSEYFLSNAGQSGNGGRRAGSLDSYGNGVFNGLHGPSQDHDIGSSVNSLQICYSQPRENWEACFSDSNSSFMDIHEGSAVRDSY